jgi:hypothetical protein
MDLTKNAKIAHKGYSGVLTQLSRDDEGFVHIAEHL